MYLVIYPLVWTPKRRKPVLVGNIGKDCKRLIEKKCEEKGWDILELTVQPEHVQFFVRVWPTTSAAEVVKDCKGITSHELGLKYPALKRMPSLWTRSYFAATAGNASAATIQAYIAAQKGF